MLLAIGYRLLSTYKIHRIVTITSSFVNFYSYKLRSWNFSITFATLNKVSSNCLAVREDGEDDSP